ncbi:unnamed protein product [Toxocara canis]|uniref:Secreted protein n=1 Tax=Toxocara canis TaxID=6265 RepID=A0A183UTP2_TOXCA|nr:unnamed protein product [Toxocara canis]
MHQNAAIIVFWLCATIEVAASTCLANMTQVDVDHMECIKSYINREAALYEKEIDEHRRKKASICFASTIEQSEKEKRCFLPVAERDSDAVDKDRRKNRRDYKRFIRDALKAIRGAPDAMRTCLHDHMSAAIVDETNRCIHSKNPNADPMPSFPDIRNASAAYNEAMQVTIDSAKSKQSGLRRMDECVSTINSHLDSNGSNWVGSVNNALDTCVMGSPKNHVFGLNSLFMKLCRKLMLPISVLPLCLFRKQGYVLVKDANIPQSQDLPQKTTPKPPEGWGDKNDDTLRNVKTLTRSESMKPSDQQAQPHSSDDPLRHKLANDGERKDENRRHEKENEDEKRAEPTY